MVLAVAAIQPHVSCHLAQERRAHHSSRIRHAQGKFTLFPGIRGQVANWIFTRKVTATVRVPQTDSSMHKLFCN